MRPRALFVTGLVAALVGVAGALVWRGAFRGAGVEMPPADSLEPVGSLQRFDVRPGP